MSELPVPKNSTESNNTDCGVALMTNISEYIRSIQEITDIKWMYNGYEFYFTKDRLSRICNIYRIPFTTDTSIKFTRKSDAITIRYRLSMAAGFYIRYNSFYIDVELVSSNASVRWYSPRPINGADIVYSYEYPLDNFQLHRKTYNLNLSSALHENNHHSLLLMAMDNSQPSLLDLEKTLEVFSALEHTMPHIEKVAGTS